MRTTRIGEIRVINGLISHGDVVKLRGIIEASELMREDNNPNEYLNMSDSTGSSILLRAQNTLKLHIEKNIGQAISDEGIGTIVKFGIGWELPYHCDQWSNLPTYSGAPRRDISSVVYLSDDFAGGEIEFPDLGVSIEPSAGSAIYFPGTEQFMHQVNKVTSGARLTCTSFWSILSTHDHVSIPASTNVQV